MSERVAVVTGASSGIGKEAAKALALQGWRVIGIGRSPERSAAAAAEIAAAGPAIPFEMLVADLARMAQARRVAGEIAARVDRIDVLINNAGGMCSDFVVTDEGLEENFAGNHLGPFVLTNALLPLLRVAAKDAPANSVRIINVSSDASEMIPGLDWDDLQQLNTPFTTGKAYCQSKLANVMFARALARREGANGIVAMSVHPGTIDSNFASHAPESTQAYIATLDLTTPAKAAEPLVWLATAPEPGEASGAYYHQGAQAPANPFAQDDAQVERLWAESERIVEAV